MLLVVDIKIINVLKQLECLPAVLLAWLLLGQICQNRG